MRNSKLVVSLMLLMVASTQLFAQKQNDKTALANIMRLQQNAWNNGNLDSFMLYYWHSPALRFVSKKGVRNGWQDVYDNYKKSYADKAQMGVLSFDIKSIDLIDKNNAMIIGSWQVKNDTGLHDGYFSLWFKEIDGKWVIVVDHTS